MEGWTFLVCSELKLSSLTKAMFIMASMKETPVSTDDEKKKWYL